MRRQDDGPDWVFIGSIMIAIASVIAFAALAFYVFVIAPPALTPEYQHHDHCGDAAPNCDDAAEEDHCRE